MKPTTTKKKKVPKKILTIRSALAIKTKTTTKNIALKDIEATNNMQKKEKSWKDFDKKKDVGNLKTKMTKENAALKEIKAHNEKKEEKFSKRIWQ